MKNFLMISPHYPVRLRFFANRLKARGFRVLALGDADFGALHPELQADLAEYCKVDLACYANNEEIDWCRYDAIRDAAKYMADKYGPIDYLDSFNEWWLPLDAALRHDLGVPGIQPKDLPRLVRKSEMKKVFREAGVAVVDGQLVHDLDGLLAFFDRCGGDIIAKPDRGVGASDTHRLRSREEVERFFTHKDPAIPYFVEKFIAGEGRQLGSFDGFVDAEGKPVFYTFHMYNDGILEVVEGNPLSYHNYRLHEIPAAVKKAGLASVEAFGLRKNFFHIEFFLLGGVCYGLEINARPPGVLTLDMMNHSKGIDAWDMYAAVCAGQEFERKLPRDLVAAYAARVNGRQYKVSHEELLAKYPGEIVHHQPMDSKVMGDYAYILLTKDQKRRLQLMSDVNA